MQQDFTLKYTLNKFDNLIEVSISRKAIQLKNIKKNLILCISILRSWKGKRFLVSDAALQRMFVLHHCVMKNEFRMLEHLSEAMLTIFSNILEEDILLFYAGLLSLKDHTKIISKQFQKIWQNKIIQYYYKIGKYTNRRNLLSYYAINHVMIPIYDKKIKIFQDLMQLEKKR